MGRLDFYNISFYAARVAANLSQADVAKAAGLPRGTVVELETGRTVDPHPREVYVKAARVLGVDVKKILPGSTENLIVKALHHFRSSPSRDERALALLIAMTSDPDVVPADRDFLSTQLAAAQLATIHQAARPAAPVVKSAVQIQKDAEAFSSAITTLQAAYRNLNPADPMFIHKQFEIAASITKCIQAQQG